MPSLGVQSAYPRLWAHGLGLDRDNTTVQHNSQLNLLQ